MGEVVGRTELAPDGPEVVPALGPLNISRGAALLQDSDEIRAERISGRKLLARDLQHSQHIN